MRNSKLFILGLAGILSLHSCGENKNEKETIVPMQNDSRRSADEQSTNDQSEGGNLDDGAQAANVEFEDQDIAAVYEHYLQIKSALVNSNAEEAKNGAQMMAEALQKSNAGEGAGNAAQEIAGSENLNDQRTAFQDLSAEVEEMISGGLTSGEVYKQYCPMAFEGKGGYWLSASEEIRNPYYGDKMLKCGRVEETIN